MSSLSSYTVGKLKQLAVHQKTMADGKAANAAMAFGAKTLGPDQIHQVMDRKPLSDAIKQTADGGTVGALMTLSDELSLMAALERDLQSAYKPRLRCLAHAMSRRDGQSRPGGVLLYGIPQIISRPESI